MLGIQSNDRARVDMFKIAYDSAVENGTPVPKPEDYLRQNPSTSGKGGLGINISVGGDVKAQR